MKPLQGRTIIVTGAAQGIGAEFACALAAEGASVSLCDLHSCEAVIARIQAAGGQAVGRICDVTDSRAVHDMVAWTADLFGGLQGLVNNAALFAALEKQKLEDVSSETFDRIMAVNVRGAFECIKAVAPLMRRVGYGKIVNIASGTVFKGSPKLLPYVTSKGALVAMTRAAARELGPAGVRVNCLAPGFTLSEGVREHPDWLEDGVATVQSRCLQRDQTPQDLVGGLNFLMSPASDFMTGQVMVVDGGAVMP